MKLYSLLIKSGSDYPDFEVEAEARTKKAALRKIVFANKWLLGYDQDNLQKWIEEVPKDIVYYRAHITQLGESF